MLKSACEVVLQVHLDFLMPKALDGFLTKLTDVSTTNHTFRDVMYYTRMYCVCISINVNDQQPLALSLSLLSEFLLSIGKYVLCILTHVYIYMVE